MIQHAQIAAELIQHAALQMDQADDIGHQRGVVFRIHRGLQVADVAADAREVLPEIDQQTVGWVPVVVERVVGQRIAHRRRQGFSALQFLADWQRGLAVTVAPQACTGGVRRRRPGRKSCRTPDQIHKGRRRIKGQQSVPRIVVTVGQIVRQLDLLLIDRITKL